LEFERPQGGIAGIPSLLTCACPEAVGNKDFPLATQKSDDWIMEEVPPGVLATNVGRPLSGPDRQRVLDALRAQDRDRHIHEAWRTIEELATAAGQ
jgi:hypothetical protein